MSGRSNLKLTEKVIEDIAVALRAGNYVDDAAQFAGVPRSSLYRWLGKGDAAIDKAESGETLTRNEQLYADLVDAVEKARAQATVRNVSLITQAAQGGQWQAAAWWLERTNPKKWGRKIQTEVSGPDSGPINLNVSIDDLEAAVQQALNGHDRA